MNDDGCVDYMDGCDMLTIISSKKIGERESCAEGEGKMGMGSNWGQCSMMIHPHPYTHTHIYLKREREQLLIRNFGYRLVKYGSRHSCSKKRCWKYLQISHRWP